LSIGIATADYEAAVKLHERLLENTIAIAQTA
jgi:hypothetical protein